MSDHIRITISYGYDIHSLVIAKDEYDSIQEGSPFAIDGQGFMHEEDGLVADHWVFNSSPGEVMFWLDNGAEFFSQEIWTESI